MALIENSHQHEEEEEDDDAGYKQFGCYYRYKGAQWGFDIYARDWDDAEARIAALAATAEIDGETIAEIPCTRAGVRTTGTIVQAVCNAANALRRVFHPRP
jgi:hypothetical protein